MVGTTGTFDATLNNQGDPRLAEIQKELQAFICAGPLFGCTVTVTEFKNGSTVVIGNADVPKGSDNDALLNKARNKPIVNLGNAKVTAVSQSRK